MYSPISESNSDALASEAKSKKRQSRWDQKTRSSTGHHKRSKHKHHHRSRKESHHKRHDSSKKKRSHTKSDRHDKKESRSAHASIRRQNRSPDSKPETKGSKLSTRLSGSFDMGQKSCNSETTFLGEMLRSSISNRSLDRTERAKLWETLNKSQEKKNMKKDLEDGEIQTDDSTSPEKLPKATTVKTKTPPDDKSYTPPFDYRHFNSSQIDSHLKKSEALLAVICTDKETELKVHHQEVEERTKANPEISHKKISVLDLPMPPILINPRKVHLKCTESPKAHEPKPEHVKLREAHFKEICTHLNANPVVISPCENIHENNSYSNRARTRPTIINRQEGTQEYPDRHFETFKTLEQVGEGTYGKVYKAIDLKTMNLVAMKFVRMEREYDGFPITGLREIKILRQLSHPNIVQLREIVFRDHQLCKKKGTYLVFEYMNHDLLGLLDNESMKFDEDTIYRIFKQILEGISYCHQKKILHRDMKCSNILVNSEGIVKLADFGLGRQWEEGRLYTNKVISLWYRPIELLLGEEKYGPAVDIWSLGCILGEMFQRRSVFTHGSEIQIIQAIFNLCGTPTKHSWPEVKHLKLYQTLQPKPCRRVVVEYFSRIIPPLALDLFDKMLCLNPEKRISAEDCLKSTWIVFMNQKIFKEPLKLPIERDCHEMNSKLNRKKRSEVSQVEK